MDAAVAEEEDSGDSQGESTGDTGSDAGVDAADASEGDAASDGLCASGRELDDAGVCRDFDPCAAGADPCDDDPAACVEAITGDGAGYICRCPVGFEGEGIGADGCTDIDECATGSAECDPLAPCNNTPGSYTCGDCDPGYKGGGPSACVDIDECGAGTSGCDSLAGCNNSPGSFACGACPEGFTGTGGAGCVPALVSITPSNGVLSPGVDLRVSQYTVRVPLDVETVTLALEAPQGTRIRAQDTQLSGASWTSPSLTPGPNVFELVIERADGQASRSYTITIERGYLEALIKAPERVMGMGYSVASAGGTLVVGVPWSNVAYVYGKKASGWELEATLRGSNTESGDEFGASVAVSASRGERVSGGLIVVGAPGEDSAAVGVNGDQTSNGAPDSGAVYVFLGDAQIAYLKQLEVTGAGDRFGSSVTTFGDYVAGGAPLEDSSEKGVDRRLVDDLAKDSGAVYVYNCGGARRNCGGQVNIKASNASAGDAFGTSLAGLVTTDELGLLLSPVLAVGAPGEKGDATGVRADSAAAQVTKSLPDSGAVYLFDVRARSPLAYVKATNAGRGDRFGTSVALDPLFLVVGAPLERSSATGVGGNQADDTLSSAGAAYVYSIAYTGSLFSSSDLAPYSYLKATNTGSGDAFGSAVAVSGSHVVVGAPGEDSRARGVGGNQRDEALPGSGAVYAFVREAGSFVPQAYLKSPHPSEGDAFGRAVAVDELGVYAGADREDSAGLGVDSTGNAGSDDGADGSGAVYVFR